MKFKFRFVEQVISEVVVEAPTQEEAEDIFSERIPDNAEHVDILDFDGGIAYEILEIDEVKE